MENRKSIQILRASELYDPSTSEEILLDGQPFYSKKTKQMYIGDGVAPLKNLKGTKIGLNLENGEGIDCLIQVYSGDVDDTHYESICSGESSVSLGEANNISGKRSLSTGKLNDIKASNALSAGLQNALGKNATNAFSAGQGNIIGDNSTGSGRSSIVGGLKNTITDIGQQSLVVGTQNIVRALNSKVSGKSNKASGESIIVSGQSNEILKAGEVDSQGKLTLGEVENTTATSNIIVGDYNIVKAKDSAIFGTRNILNLGNNSYGSSFIAGANNYSQADKTFLLGNGLEVRSYLQTAVGTYNKYDTNALFVVGNGTGSNYNNRKNAFEVKRVGGFNSFGDSTVNGKLVVTSDPVDDTDVVRLKDLNSIQDSLQYATLDEVTSLWD